MTKTQDGTALFEVGERVTVARNITVETTGRSGGGCSVAERSRYILTSI